MTKEETFTRIIKQNEGVIYKITRLYTRNEEDQKDLYQEIVFQLWKAFDGFRHDAKISTWMYRIALNTALFHLKKDKRSGHSVSLDTVVLKQKEYDPLLDERLNVLYDSIRNLEDLDKAIVFLFLEEKKYEEIAVITGITTSNVSTRMARIKEKLKTQIIKK